MPVAAPPSKAGLPRGRHALPRDQVLSTQRARLLRAMTDEVAERGYAATTAVSVFRRAGVSSRAFYEIFTGVEDCFLAAYDACSAAAAEAVGRGQCIGSARDRFAAMLETYLGLLAAEPAMARTFLVEVYAAGPAAVQRRVDVHRRFTDLTVGVLAGGRRRSRADVAAVATLVDAVTFAVTLHVAAGEFDALPGLRPDLLAAADRLCPWLVHEPRPSRTGAA